MISVVLPLPSTTNASRTPGSFFTSSRLAERTLPPTAGHFSYTAYFMPGRDWSMPNSGAPVTTSRLSTPVNDPPNNFQSLRSLSLTASGLGTGTVSVAASAAIAPYPSLRLP